MFPVRDVAPLLMMLARGNELELAQRSKCLNFSPLQTM